MSLHQKPFYQVVLSTHKIGLFLSHFNVFLSFFIDCWRKSNLILLNYTNLIKYFIPMMAASPKSTRSLSDSEESFHLGLPEECDIELLSQNASDKNSPTNDETEEDILNKIQTSDGNNDMLDATDEDLYLKTEDSIVEDQIDGDEASSTKMAKESVNEEASSPIIELEPTVSETSESEKTVVKVKIEAQKYTAGADYEHNIDGEFRSLYEVDNDENKAADEAMDVEDNDENAQKKIINSEDAEMTNLEKNNEKPSDAIEEKERAETPENLDENFKVPNNTEDLLTKEKNISEDETEDLLDVSMVRDPEEDDACAIADAIRENLEEQEEEEEEEKDVSSSEKEDEERMMDIEQDVSETEKEAESCIKSDDKSSIENNLEENLNNKTDDDNYQAENNKTDSSLQIDESHEDLHEFDDLEIDKISKNSEETDIIEISEDSVLTEKISSNNTNIEISKAETSSSTNIDIIPNNSSEKLLTNNKRTRDNSESNVSDTDDELSKKRICIENELSLNNLQINANNQVDNKNKEPPPLHKFKYLSSFARYMQNKNLTTSLTLSDLEEYVRQKVVETLKIHSVEGISHQKIQLLETRCEAQEKTIKQLSKHCNDLKLVNERLMVDVRKQYGTRKPTVPLKITRSVGLQVRRNPSCSEILSFQTRKPPNTVLISSPKSYTPKVKPAINNTVVNNNNNNNNNSNTIQRQICAVSLNTSPLNGATTTTTATTQAQSPVIIPKRSSAGKRTNNNNNSVSKKLVTESPKNGKAHSVIDLTDDDRILPGLTVLKSPNQNKQLNQNIIAKNSLSSAMRLPPGSVITSTANNGSRQMLYVVPGLAGIDYTNLQTNGNQPQIALLNFQTSPNGLITTSNLNNSLTSPVRVNNNNSNNKHPASLPAPPRIVLDPKLKSLLPKPFLSIRKAETGIILKWLMPYKLDLYADISGYQLFAYQETNTPPNTDMWRKVGDVVALKLPMACTLTQFADNNTYYFAVRAVDVHKRCGSFSDPESIVL